MTENSAKQKIVGVRFSKVGKIYNFDATGLDNLRKADVVVVETSRGWQMGEVVTFIEQSAEGADATWKPLDRVATPQDLAQWQVWQNKEPEVIAACKDRAKELRLNHVKIVSSEYSFDGTRLTILFSSDTEEKAELKSLRSDMQRTFAPAQVELRQIGPRDVAKILGGMGACGMETRCCTRFITEFSSISIKMAKEQGISLTPAEITGMCGRLRCCLIYEYDNYLEARKNMPKKNKKVMTPDGEGKVVDLQPLAGKVVVDIPQIGRREFSNEDVKLVEEEEIIKKAAKSFVKKHTGGDRGRAH